MNCVRIAIALFVIYAMSSHCNAYQTGCSCSEQTKKPLVSKPFSCGNKAKAICELNIGHQYLSLSLWSEALQHCSSALNLTISQREAQLCIDKALSANQEARHNRFKSRLELVDADLNKKAYESAESEYKSLREYEKAESDKFGVLSYDDEHLMDRQGARIAEEKEAQWPACLTAWLGLRFWLPGVATQTLRILTYLLIALCVWQLVRMFRNMYRGFYWRNIEGPIRWSVSSIADDTKQSASGAVMDALNVYHNPLFQPLNTSSLLAAPPALAERTDASDPSYLVWRNFLVDYAARPMVREYLSDLIEYVEIEKFSRHTFEQVNAFEGINLKLGAVEASLGAMLRGLRGWWTKGWPSVTGSVVLETIGEDTFASVRLICNYGLKRNTQRESLAPYDIDITPRELFSDERTFAVFASTAVDEFTDAVALASQRAAFRLLYRLAKRPAEPNLAIAASSYRQGLRLLVVVL